MCIFLVQFFTVLIWTVVELMVWATYLHVFLWIFHHIIIIISWKLCIDQLHTCSQFDTTTYNYCFSSSILFNLRPISNLRERRISNLLFNTKIYAFVRSIKVDLTEFFLSSMHSIQSWENLIVIRNEALHLWLLPNIDSSKINQTLVCFMKFLPKSGEIVAILACWIINLHNPDIIRVSQKMLVVLWI